MKANGICRRAGDTASRRSAPRPPRTWGRCGIPAGSCVLSNGNILSFLRNRVGPMYELFLQTISQNGDHGIIERLKIGIGGSSREGTRHTVARLILLGCMAYLTIGFSELVVGAVLEPMVHAYGVQYGDGGQLVMNQFLGGLLGTLCAPWLIGRLGRKRVLLSAMGLMAVAVLAYAALPPWGVMLTIAPFTGFGFGTIETLVGSVIIAGAGERANTAMGRVETCFGIGALVIPFAGAALIDMGQWRFAFVFVGLLALISFALWTRYWPAGLGSGRTGERNAPHGGAGGHSVGGHAGGGHASGGGGAGGASRAATASAAWGKGGAWAILIVCALYFAVYVGMEMSFVHYLPSLLVQKNHLSDATAALAVGMFWGAMTIGRLVAGNVADRIGEAGYLFGSSIIVSALFLLMSLTGGTTAMLVLTFLAGLFMSGMFAVGLVFSNRAITGVTERTTSLLIASGLLGGAVMPKITGWCLDQYGADTTRWLFTIVSAVLLVIMGVAAAIALRARGHLNRVRVEEIGL